MTSGWFKNPNQTLDDYTTSTHKIPDKTESNLENCDILFIDLPQTQNIHHKLFEAWVRQKTRHIINPNIDTINLNQHEKYIAHITFDRIIATIGAGYVLLRHDCTGALSKSFVEASLKRYSDTYECKNIKSDGGKECLYFIRKKDLRDVKYESPLNYAGGKSKIIAEIKENLPKNFDSFIDMFGGGFNVGINIDSDKIVYNDINYLVKDIVESFLIHDTYEYLTYIDGTIRKFGLEKTNSETYVRARNYYNSLPVEQMDPRLLYAIILYGYQQQIRFNGNYGFNNAVGMSGFNDSILEKIISFSRILKEKNVVFQCSDYTDILKNISNDAFVYMDPPYMLTTGSYNDGKRGFLGWTTSLEKELLEAIDSLDRNGNKFMVSYVVQHKGKINYAVKSWIEDMGYRQINLKIRPGVRRKEILIMNY